MQKQSKQNGHHYVDVDRNLEKTTSNAELLNTVLRVARMLKITYRFQPGDAIALNLHNTPEIYIFTLPLDLRLYYRPIGSQARRS